MKTAIYIEDGIVQLVLTPENEFEKNALAAITKNPFEAKIFNGQFYDCQGGWTRQRDEVCQPPWHQAEENSNKSLILRVEPAKEKAVPQN